jgi:branched-chain amino acid transport system permease protein
MGVWPMVISFAIVILGGLGSIKGSIVGAYVVGFLETTMTTYVNPRMTGVASLILLVGFLLVRPTGLFGHDVEI